MWIVQDGKVVWTGGKADWKAAADAACACGAFSPDCEEECVAEEEVSCYNCRYRRWTRESMICMRKAKT